MKYSLDETDYEVINVIDCLQYVVDDITAEHWKKDACPPEFLVSENIEEGKILLTITHGGFSHTKAIFPNGEYGNEKILSVMKSLYNSTM